MKNATGRSKEMSIWKVSGHCFGEDFSSAQKLFLNLAPQSFSLQVSNQAAASECLWGENSVFDVWSDCKDKAAHLTHSAAAAAASVVFFFLNTFFIFYFKAFHPRWHWPFQYLGTTTLPVCKVPTDGWCETAISQPIPQPQITVPVRSNHNVEKSSDCTASNLQSVS